MTIWFQRQSGTVIISGCVDIQPKWSKGKLRETPETQQTSLICMLSFMFCQSVATLTIEVVPYMVYFWAWVSYVRDFNRAGVFPSLYAYKKGYRRQNPHLDRQYDRFEQRYNLVQQRDEYKRENPNCFHSVLKNLWSGVKWGTVALIAVAAFGYAVMLGISVEFTIRAADLNPEGNALDSSQLLPLLTGIVAFISALGNALDNLLLSKTPVRFERLPHGKILVFTKDGNGLPDETLELMKARRKP
ncbi:hypothetical protein SLS56_006384 [Neofusicoccum ribis]|uniref:Uncharacterized protein n=1 Tax=Neofusicoccum ribis TaxID=45134 RepID=A0ABR3SR50_9PEZI